MDKYLAMRAFLAIVRAGSFVKAAEQLDMSTTTCSRLLTELEAQLGVRLVQRTTRTLSITEAGQQLAARFESINAEIEAAEQEVQSATHRVAGTLRVAMPQVFGLSVIAPMLHAFRQQHPALVLEVTASDRRMDLVAEGFDLALRITGRLDEGYVARQLAPIRVAVCASPGYLQRRGTPLTPAALDSHDCLTYLETAGPNQWVFAGPDGLVQQRVSGSFRANSGELLRVCALAGDGLIYQPTFLVGDDLRAGTLLQVLQDFLPPPLGLYAVYPDRRHLPVRTRVFVDFLIQRFEAAPPWDRDLVP